MTRGSELVIREGRLYHLGVAPGEKNVDDLSESMKIGFISEGVRDLIHACAAERPVILLLEDIHWLDDSTESLLESGAEKHRPS